MLAFSLNTCKSFATEKINADFEINGTSTLWDNVKEEDIRSIIQKRTQYDSNGLGYQTIKAVVISKYIRIT